MPQRCATIILALGCIALGGCAGVEPVVVGDPVVVTWAGDGDIAIGQVIVAVTNEGAEPVDPDVFGRGRQTVANLMTEDGRALTGGDARVQLHAVPNVLAPG